MKLDEIVAWYQKKIGTYDKQQWEKTVEQKILDGFSSVTLKTAKLKTEFIDVDLVRGSTFPKAKPKQTLLTVIRLAILRYLFLPVYASFWVKQTSPNVFAILLFLYVTQMINWAVYTFNIHRLEHSAYVEGSNNGFNHSQIIANSTTANDAENATDVAKQVEEHIVSISELLIPMTLSLLLSLIHSQIVATNTASGAKAKRRRYSKTSQDGKAPREPRVRRRRKLVKMRSQDFIDTSTVSVAAQRKSNVVRKYNLSADDMPKTLKLETLKTEPANNHSLPKVYCASANANAASVNQETFHTTSAIIRNSGNTTISVSPGKLTLDLKLATHTAPPMAPTDAADCCLGLKKRNVNWHSPIHNYATETQEKQQQTSPQSQAGTSSSSNASSSETSTSNNTGCGGGGGGGCGGSSSGSSPTKSVRIDDSVQEFYEDLISRTDRMLPPSISVSGNFSIEPQHSSVDRVAFAASRRNIGEDDGFESLNGKSSSGEETNISVPTNTALASGSKSQLRLRLNEHNTALETELKPPATACYRRKVPLSSESDFERQQRSASACDVYSQPKKPPSARGITNESSVDTDEDGDDGETISMHSTTLGSNSNYNECTTSATEWLGVTTNSEEYSYSSELDNSDSFKNNHMSDEDGYDLDYTPTIILNAHGSTDRISCTIWDQREIKKAQMSVLEISSCIIERVESMPETNDYIYIGICFSFLLSLIPSFCRLCEVTLDTDKPSEINYFDVPMLLWEKASFSFWTIFRFAFGHTQWERTVLVIGFMHRLCLTLILFIIFAVAEKTFKQRFLYAKLFSHLTSSRRARKSNLPHFRLNKVRNIKTWLSVRSYLKKRGPQRSVDIIVSAAFIVTLLLLAFLSVEWLKDSVHLHSHLNLEALMWSTTIGIFLLRFMTLGNKIHHKYRSVSVLITEQINLYLQIEQKPKKKDELMVSNSVLKLAADLLKELESPFKISGLSANPYLFTTIKVVILSALSGVLSEMLGFKLKLHKIKIK